MNASTSNPTTVQLRLAHLAGLMVAAAALAAVITWALLAFAVDTDSDAIRVKSPADVFQEVASSAPQQVVAADGSGVDLTVLSPAEREFVQGVLRYQAEGGTVYGPIYGVSINANSSLTPAQREFAQGVLRWQAQGGTVYGPIYGVGLGLTVAAGR